MLDGTDASRERRWGLTLLRLAVAACAAALAAWALAPSGAGAQEYPLPPPPPAPPPPSSTALPLLSPFPIVRIVGRTTRRGARISRLTVRAVVGTSVVSQCVRNGKTCPYTRRTTRIRGTRGQVRTIHVRGFERSFGAGVLLRVYAISAGRVGKYTSFQIRRARSPQRRDRCARGMVLRPVRCPTG